MNCQSGGDDLNVEEIWYMSNFITLFLYHEHIVVCEKVVGWECELALLQLDDKLKDPHNIELS